MTDHGRIDAAELDSVQLSADGSRLILLMRDAAGRSVSLSLPADCLNTLLTATPRQLEQDAAYSLDTWSMAPADNGRDMILTLCTPQGLAVSFIVKPWQVEGMATVVAIGANLPRSGGRHALRPARCSPTPVPAPR